MATKQYRVYVKVKMIVTVDEDETDLDAVLENMDYNFEPTTEHADIPVTEIMEWEQQGEPLVDSYLV